MTGTGTQEDPFVVYTIFELRSALGQTDAYVQMGCDIDCNDEYTIWQQLTVLATDFDLNDHHLWNINCKNGYVFYIPSDTMHLFTIHGGWIHNVELSGASFINDNCPADVSYTANNSTGNYGTVIQDMAIYTNVGELFYTGTTTCLWGRGTRFHTTVWKGKVHSASSSAYLGYNGSVGNEGILFEESRIVVQIDIPASVNRPMCINGHFIGTQVDVAVNANGIIFSPGYNTLGSYSTINNSTFNLRASDGTQCSFLSLVSGVNSAIGISTYNSDYINLTSTSEYIPQTQKPLTSSEIINSDANNAVGFHNIKVEL